MIEHPLRCETCNNELCEYFKYRHIWSTEGSCQGSAAAITWHVGCASHSDIKKINEKEYECDCKDFTCPILIMGEEPSGEYCINAINGRRCRYLKDITLMICPDRMSGRTECRLCMHNTPHKDTDYTDSTKVKNCELKSDVKLCVLYNSIIELKNEYIITEKLTRDIDIAFKLGCDGTLPNYNELMSAIRSRKYRSAEKVLDQIIKYIDDNRNSAVSGTVASIRAYLIKLKQQEICNHFYSWSGKTSCTGLWKCCKCGKLEDETSFSGHPTMHRR